MGLFDFISNSSKRFTKEEIEVLDRNFCSISSYTKKNYTFVSKEISKDLQGIIDHHLDHHVVSYIHEDIDTDEFHPNWHEQIKCEKYLIKDKSSYYFFCEFFDSRQLDKTHRLKVPLVKNFPTSFLKVGWAPNGFVIEIKYNKDNMVDRKLDNPYLTDTCAKSIKDNAVKYLKNLHK